MFSLGPARSKWGGRSRTGPCARTRTCSSIGARAEPPGEEVRRERGGEVPVGLWAIADDDPDRVALVEAGSGRELTYGELAARANQLTCGLRALGAGQGDVVAAVLGNEAAMLELYAAALQGGWYLTPINPHLTAARAPSTR